jgi:hypothetical protein
MADAKQLAEALRDLLRARNISAREHARKTAEATLAAFEAQAAMSPKQTSGTSEPVAWSVTFNGEHIGNLYQDLADAQEHKANLDASWPNEVRTVAPLFAAPVAQAEPRKPLTPEQIGSAWIDSSVSPSHAGWVTERRIAFARAIEAAHGINENP